MKKEARLLKQKSLNSLILSIEHFNRPWDQGRTDAVLMFMICTDVGSTSSGLRHATFYYQIVMESTPWPATP